ncbi:unnamed protein product [Rangifer tarandus platyrhynchus]|uniref:Uncharacterized protein n=2 Tax=Rangifer tarandus platyrhynchus TaxID=3082113 RepID=A0ABN9A355_RANTA|nr:unnamed protein product [Rangifer tarandus platyrhynchus]
MCLPLSPEGNSQAPREPGSPERLLPAGRSFQRLAVVPPWAAPGLLRGGHPVASQGPCPRRPVSGQRETQEPLETKHETQVVSPGLRGGSSSLPQLLGARVPRAHGLTSSLAVREAVSASPHEALGGAFQPHPCSQSPPLATPATPFPQLQGGALSPTTSSVHSAAPVGAGAACDPVRLGWGSGVRTATCRAGRLRTRPGPPQHFQPLEVALLGTEDSGQEASPETLQPGSWRPPHLAPPEP